jgi:hypothetical protein
LFPDASQGKDAFAVFAVAGKHAAPELTVRVNPQVFACPILSGFGAGGTPRPFRAVGEFHHVFEFVDIQTHG